MAWYNPFQRKAAPVRRDSDTPNSPLMTWQSSKGTQVRVITYDEAMAAEEAMKHPVIFRIVNKIATAVQTVQWYAEADPDAKGADRASASSIKAINSLLKSPNDNAPPDMLRAWMAMTYALYGRVPFKVGVSVDNTPNGIYPLDAKYVTGRPNSRGVIESYQYGFSETDKSNTLPTRKKANGNGAYAYEIARLNLNGLTLSTGKTNNVSPLAAISLPAAIISMLLQRAADTAAGHPNTKYIIAAEKTLTNKQKNSLKEAVESAETGDEESGHVLFIYNTSIEVHKLDNSLSDIHSKMPMDDMARFIAGSFNVPIALLGLGAADGAKFAGNYLESRRSFWEDTIIPGYLEPIASGLTAALCSPGVRVRFDLDTIPALGDVRVTRAKGLQTVSFLDENEKRELCGFEPRTQPTQPTTTAE